MKVHTVVGNRSNGPLRGEINPLVTDSPATEDRSSNRLRVEAFSPTKETNHSTSGGDTTERT